MGYPLYAVLSLIALPVYAILWVLYTRTLHPLSHIPGPFWASVSQIWNVYHVFQGDMDTVQRALHRQYGLLVRIAPDEVICADPGSIRTIYPTSKPLAKSEFYRMWHQKSFSKYPDNFANMDEKLHSERRKIVNPIYTMSTILTLEPYIDSCSELFVLRLGELADANAVIDLGEWLHWYVHQQHRLPLIS